MGAAQLTTIGSVFSRTEAALERLRRLGEDARLASVADRVKTRADQLETPVAELEILATVRSALRAQGMPTSTDTELLTGLGLQLSELADRYTNDPEQIVAADGRLRFTLWDPLRALPTSLRESLLASWRAYCRSLVPPQRLEVLAVLERIPGLQEDARAIRVMAAEFEQRVAMLPQGTEDIGRIEELGAEIQTRWGTLEGSGIPKDVLDFLAAASMGSARLDQWTPNVRAWLEDRSLLRYVTLSLSAE